MKLETKNQKRYTDYSSYVKKKFGGRVQKVSINAGFTCPNIDGSKGKGGCTYCNNNTLSKLADKALLYKKTILLFDYDHQGRYLTSRAIKTLERRSLIDVTYRRELSYASRGRIRYIEELNKFPDNHNNNCYI